MVDFGEMAYEGLDSFVRLMARNVEVPPWLLGDQAAGELPHRQPPAPEHLGGEGGTGSSGPSCARDSVGTFTAGASVSVWSNSQNCWIDDGVIQKVCASASDVDGTHVPAGSILVTFGGEGACYKWISPEHQGRLLRKQALAPTLPVLLPSTEPYAQCASLVQEREVQSKSPTRNGVLLLQDRLAELRSVELACQLERRAFEDADFRPSFRGKVNRWCRPKDIAHHDGTPLRGRDDWQLFRGEPSAEDVQQGELGDCWFLSSLAALANFRRGRFLGALLPGQVKPSPAGAYVVRLCLGGQWCDILVDDRLPCMGGGGYYTQLAYCSTRRRQLWASLVEKAFAKVCGGYEAIVAGQSQEALEVLTGWPCSVIRFGREGFDVDILWTTLSTSRDAAFLMTCSTKGAEGACEGMGLVPNHAYSLMDVHDVFDSRGEQQPQPQRVRLLKIRNPHARSTWKGAWSHRSSQWTPELRHAVGFIEGDTSGVFFIALGDFLRFFENCTICKIRSETWHEHRVLVQLPLHKVPLVGLTLKVAETTECSISIVQPEERIRQGPLYDNQLGPMACVGFVLLRLRGAEGCGEAVAIGHMRCRTVVSADCWLQPGCSYLLVPLSLHSGPQAVPVVFACVSSRLVVTSERSLSQSSARAAWAAYARYGSRGDATDFHGAKLHCAKSRGSAIVTYAENRSSTGYFRAECNFESAELSYSRGSHKTSDWLPPGYGQLVQVAMPSAETGAAWSSSNAFQMTYWSPKPPWHSPEVEPNGDGLHTPFQLPT